MKMGGVIQNEHEVPYFKNCFFFKQERNMSLSGVKC